MVELLAAEKKRLIAERGEVTLDDFRRAWDECWEVMVLERGWAHATRIRRAWRAAQDETREECCAAFLDVRTPFAVAAQRLSEAAGGMCLRLEPEQVGRAMLAAMAYVEVDEDDVARTARASDAASAFVNDRQGMAA